MELGYEEYRDWWIDDYEEVQKIIDEDVDTQIPTAKLCHWYLIYLKKQYKTNYEAVKPKTIVEFYQQLYILKNHFEVNDTQLAKMIYKWNIRYKQLGYQENGYRFTFSTLKQLWLLELLEDNVEKYSDEYYDRWKASKRYKADNTNT